MRNNKIKQIFYLLMSFLFCFHFLAPLICYFFFGLSPTYQIQYFEQASILKGLYLNLSSFVLGSFFIYITPFTPKIIITNQFYRSKIYLIIAIIFSLGALISLGNFENSLKSLHQPSGILIFGNMFVNLDYYFLFSFAFAVDFLPSTQIIYVIRNLIAASRSASLSLSLFIPYTLWSSNAKTYLKKYLIFLFMAILLSVFSFNWASNIRSQFFKKNSTINEKIIQSFSINKQLVNKIIGRVSFLELSMLPIIYKDKNLPNIQIFYDKYSVINQLKLIANNLVPGDIFASDVMPNQYYRSAFMNMSLQIAKENYTSINMTLPVYFYMYFNFLPAVIITGIIIWVYYIFTCAAFNLHPIIGSIFIYNFYSYFLSFFDFVTLIKFLALGIIATSFFMISSKLEIYIVNFIKSKMQQRNKVI